MFCSNLPFIFLIVIVLIVIFLCIALRRKKEQERFIMFCSKCGEKIEEGSKFCAKCGTPVGEDAGMPMQTPAQPQQYRQTAETKMNPLQYVAAALKKYAVFSGRARRAEFWWFALFSSLISFVAGFIGGYLGFGNILSILANLFLFLPGLAVSIRRMHDVGKSGWYWLIPIYDFILSVTAGNAGANKYGPDPKGA